MNAVERWEAHRQAIQAMSAAEKREYIQSGRAREDRRRLGPPPRPMFAAWPVPEEPVRLSAWQAGRCAMCGVPEANLVLDHDHDTWKIRGYLCGSCNQDEAQSDAWFWVAWREGLNPARRLGIDEDYYFEPKPPPAAENPLFDDAIRRMEL